MELGIKLNKPPRTAAGVAAVLFVLKGLAWLAVPLLLALRGCRS